MKNLKSENLIRAGIVQYDLLERHVAPEAHVLRRTKYLTGETHSVRFQQR